MFGMIVLAMANGVVSIKRTSYFIEWEETPPRATCFNWKGMEKGDWNYGKRRWIFCICANAHMEVPTWYKGHKSHLKKDKSEELM